MAARTGNALGFASFASLLQWAHARAGSIPHTAARANAPWRKVFQAAGMIQLIPLLMLAYVSGREGGAGGHESVARTRPRPPRRDASASATSSPVAHPSLAILRELSRRPEFWLHSIFRSCIMVLVSFLLFVPSYGPVLRDVVGGIRSSREPLRAGLPPRGIHPRGMDVPTRRRDVERNIDRILVSTKGIFYARIPGHCHDVLNVPNGLPAWRDTPHSAPWVAPHVPVRF